MTDRRSCWGGGRGVNRRSFGRTVIVLPVLAQDGKSKGTARNGDLKARTTRRRCSTRSRGTGSTMSSRALIFWMALRTLGSETDSTVKNNDSRVLGECGSCWTESIIMPSRRWGRAGRCAEASRGEVAGDLDRPRTEPTSVPSSALPSVSSSPPRCASEPPRTLCAAQRFC
jgi:hypothetical protein